MKKFKVNDNCISCGACVAIAEDTFEFNDDMQAVATKNNILDKMDDALKNRAMDALEGCPVGAIELVETTCDCDNCECHNK